MVNDIYDNHNKIYESKKQKLNQIIASYLKQDVILAFTGGVGSSLLLSLLVEYSKENAGKVYAITINTLYKPAYDLAIARKVAKELSAVHSVISLDESKQSDLSCNPQNRCYLCKKSIFSKLMELADELEVPGIQAIKELDINNPYEQAGFTRDDVVRYAKERNISVAEKPDSSCMATRFPYGTKLDTKLIRTIEQCEEYIKSLGISNVRVRVHDNIARIEVSEKDIERVMMNNRDISDYLHDRGFEYVTLDLIGYRPGSMNH